MKGTLNTPRFYEGVDVQPGHVAANLAVARPVLQRTVRRALEDARPILIVGPSGAGKSALAWMTAYETRDQVIWYRVDRLHDVDVEPVIRLIRMNRPSEDSSIGIVADNLGRRNRDGWDSLVDKAVQLPGVKLLGVVREEDLPQVASAAISFEVRPTLDETLGQRLWEELKASGATHWLDWREPFERSSGLLLEYTYLLSAGDRLNKTIQEQIDTRLREGRDVELKILRSVALAHWCGVDLSLVGLRVLLGDVSDEAIARALHRLIDEHMVRRDEHGRFSGLHQIRSLHIVEATHRFGAPSLADTAVGLIGILEAEDLETFMQKILIDKPMFEEAIVEAAQRRLSSDSDPFVAIAILRALRVAGFQQIVATQWRTILEEESVPASRYPIAIQLALAGITHQAFLPSIQSAVSRIAAVELTDRRLDFIGSVDPVSMDNIVSRIDDVTTAHNLFAALIGCAGDRIAEQLLKVRPPVDDQPIDKIAQLIAGAREVDLRIAQNLAASAGGTEELIDRVRRENPWLRNLRLEPENDTTVVGGDVLAFAPSITDPHEATVDLCKLLLGCVPEAEIAACTAIDVTGRPAGYGDYIVANKRIKRERLPIDAVVEWNRLRSRIADGVLSSTTITERLIKESDLLEKYADTLFKAVTTRVSGLHLSEKSIQDLVTLAEQADHLPTLPLPPLAAAPTNDESIRGVDPIANMLKETASVIVLLRQGEWKEFITLRIRQAIQYSRDVVHQDRWRLLSSSPVGAFHRITGLLSDLLKIASEMVNGDEQNRTKLEKVAKRSGVPRCAEVASAMASERLERDISTFVAALRARGYSIQVLRRAPEDDTLNLSPADELLAIVTVPDLAAWLAAQPLLVVERERTFGKLRRLDSAPMRAGKVVSSLGCRVQSQCYPIPKIIDGWASAIDLPILENLATAAFETARQSLELMSSILGWVYHGELHDDEYAALKEAEADYLDAREALSLLARDDKSGLLDEVLEFLNGMASQVETQSADVNAGGDGTPDLALALASGVRGAPNDLLRQIGFFRLGLLEHDVDPEGAVERTLDGLRTLDVPDSSLPPSH